MKLAHLIPAVLAASPLAAAWKVQLYDKELYKDIIHERDGTLKQPCKNLGSNVNKAQSMHWDSCNLVTCCKIRLYDSGDCSGNPLGDSGYEDWNLPAFSTKAKNKVNSYKIDC
ncbi:hypothetical protein H2203_001612 [Taxawa tesnikishii (nom. ined.)]|nr:hypothetical protein H2203_001612 [Dothideales sp. JES 119]